MKLNKYIASTTQAEFARAIGVKHAVVYQWVTGRRPVPIERCAEIEKATNGLVSRKDLRPDDWHRIWPELIGKQAA